MPDSGEWSPPPRLPSGVAGLDHILHGGFYPGGSYIIAGEPGTGKTTVGNQICFHHIGQGGRAVYVTLLAESHAHLIEHLSGLAFFDRAAVGDALYYISGSADLERGGYQAVLDTLRHLIRERHATLLVIDGIPSEDETQASQLNFKRFLQKLQVVMEANRCTTFMLAHIDPDIKLHQSYTLVDGMIELINQRDGMRATRMVEVRKLRGSGYLEGRHLMELTDAGMVVYPRTESVFAAAPPADEAARAPMAWDIARLDEMTQGGLLSGSTTLVLGPTGSGKTLLGLHFLMAGAQRGESGLYFGFYETPSRLIQKAERLGLPLRSAVAQGTLQVMWQPPLEALLDKLAERLLQAVKEHKVSRLFIDGINGFGLAANHPERIAAFFTALTNELRSQNVTTYITVEQRNLINPSLEIPVDGVSAIAENIIFLRYVELRSQLKRLISIIKMRDSDYDASIREFKITQRGIQVAESFDSAEAILTGVSHIEPATTPAEQATAQRKATP